MTFLDVCLLAFGLAFAASLVRVARGPTLADRAAAADVCLFILVSALAILAIRSNSPAFIDVVLVATLLGFIATISFARLLRRR